jgi:type II secretory pathway pseudopilin PulG
MMIVLAIAGMILLIIFEAIPALQRSSRNNQRRQDIQTMLAAVSHYELNDSGNFPQPCGQGSLTVAAGTISFVEHDITVGGVAYCNLDPHDPAHPNDNFLKDVAKKLTYYEKEGIGLYPQTTAAGADNQRRNITAGITDPDKVVILNYEKCGTNGTATIQGAGYSDVVALFAVETGRNGHQSQCQQL